jgi:hypothetical protein
MPYDFLEEEHSRQREKCVRRPDVVGVHLAQQRSQHEAKGRVVRDEMEKEAEANQIEFGSNISKRRHTEGFRAELSHDLRDLWLLCCT